MLKLGSKFEIMDNQLRLRKLEPNLVIGKMKLYPILGVCLDG